MTSFPLRGTGVSIIRSVGEIDGEWLYGRGADDMKDAIAALLFAIEALQETGIKPQFNIECSFTCDEETGGQLGAGYIVEEGLVHADYVVNCEGGSEMNIGNGTQRRTLVRD